MPGWGPGQPCSDALFRQWHRLGTSAATALHGWPPVLCAGVRAPGPARPPTYMHPRWSWPWLLHSLSGKGTRTCFIRSKSKASRATSLTLPAGFILGRGRRVWSSGCACQALPRWGMECEKEPGCHRASAPGGPCRPGQAPPSSCAPQRLLLYVWPLLHFVGRAQCPVSRILRVL